MQELKLKFNLKKINLQSSVAQLVEQRAVNSRVTGSNPVGGVCEYTQAVNEGRL